MKIHTISQKNLYNAAHLLLKGGIVAFPTETVYGLGALASDDEAVNRVYKIKKRPKNNPLIVHIHSIEHIKSIVQTVPDCANKLIEKFWPGPLTLILPYKNNGYVSKKARANLNSIAIRMPNNPIAIKLLKKVNLPIIAPSANLSQHLSPTRAIHVKKDLGSRLDPLKDMILDGGECNLGIESTVVDVTSEEPVILRTGVISCSMISKILNMPVKIQKDIKGKIKSPGMMKKHYAPKTELRLNAKMPLKGEVWLGFGKEIKKYNVKSKNLSIKGNIEEAAVNLYSMLRELDDHMAQRIAVANIPNQGIGEAINDRLKRGAAKEI